MVVSILCRAWLHPPEARADLAVVEGMLARCLGAWEWLLASSGDYSVAQVTGAAADSAVVHLANPETITGAKTFTSNVTMSGNLLLPQGNGYVPAVGGIGLDTAAGLPVVNIGGTTQQVALTSSNISGQAGTALALAAVPTQCSGSFATGIAANGNANCTTPDIVQLPETTPPDGIPNWGVFWFDSTKHAPFFIDNSGQVVQLGLTNLFNSDPGGDAADNLEERNGTNPQNLRVYSSYMNNHVAADSLGYDAADNYAVIQERERDFGIGARVGVLDRERAEMGGGCDGSLEAVDGQSIQSWQRHAGMLSRACLPRHRLIRSQKGGTISRFRTMQRQVRRWTNWRCSTRTTHRRRCWRARRRLTE